jgi:hypothetical protein
MGGTAVKAKEDGFRGWCGQDCAPPWPHLPRWEEGEHDPVRRILLSLLDVSGTLAPEHQGDCVVVPACSGRHYGVVVLDEEDGTGLGAAAPRPGRCEDCDSDRPVSRPLAAEEVAAIRARLNWESEALKVLDRGQVVLTDDFIAPGGCRAHHVTDGQLTVHVTVGGALWRTPE